MPWAKRRNAFGVKIEKDKIIKDFIEKALKEKTITWGYFRKIKKRIWYLNISHTSIYKWIYSNAQRNAQYLCFRRYRRKAQKINRSKREMRRWICEAKEKLPWGIPELVSMDLIPKEGIHWEGDLFVSPSKLNHSVSWAMFVESKSQLMKGYKMKNRKALTMVKVVNSFLKDYKVSDITFEREAYPWGIEV